MNEIELLIDLYKDCYRQGPGDRQHTLKALSYIDLKPNMQILDLGCGTGESSLTLAKATDSQVTCIDLSQIFLDKLNKQAHLLNLNNFIQTQCQDMQSLTQEKKYDLIWAEGSVYNMGFYNACLKYYKFLKANAYIVFSELSLFNQNANQYLIDYWQNLYPEFDTIENKVKQMQSIGYKDINTFKLSNDTFDLFYKDVNAKLEAFSQRHTNDDAMNIVLNHKKELEIYQKYKEDFGYAFYIGKRI